ncbi:MAG: hypothetical protein WHT22_00400 [Bacteroidales bacterium]
MNLNERIAAFSRMGVLIQCATGDGISENLSNPEKELVLKLRYIIEDHVNTNPWFDAFHVRYALRAISDMLREDALQEWVSHYPEADLPGQKTIALIMAGNLPAVGFHDFLSVLITGHAALIRNSSDDPRLIPWMASCLKTIHPDFSSIIQITNEPMHGFDAIIATGSNNSARYFEYYFGKYPHIIRRNMNSVAVLSGHETPEELEGISDDILLYYGRGCRSVSQLLVPRNYDFKPLIQAIQKYAHYAIHHKFFNNYEYNKAVMLVNKVPHIDTGFLLLTENASLNSPLAVIHYLYYDNPKEVENYLNYNAQSIQCVSTSLPLDFPHVRPGTTQIPALNDYADRVDTIAFLCELKKIPKSI